MLKSFLSARLNCDKIVRISHCYLSNSNLYKEKKTYLLIQNIKCLVSQIYWNLCFYVQKMNMAKMRKIAPPDDVRGMTVLDRTKFDGKYKINSLKVKAKDVNVVLKKLKPHVFKKPKFPPVKAMSEQKDYRLILLHPDIIPNFKTLESCMNDFMKYLDITEENWESTNVDLTYENWSTVDIFTAVLPPDVPLSSFSTVGHIAHFNLRPAHLPYKKLIGEVIVDKTKCIKTVVNKLDTINNVFRNFQMELLAGEDNMTTVTKEHGCTFKLDFSKVYWNPRLSLEHQRIVQNLQKDDILYDVFAGVGPFAIPAAKKQCIVLANDLNPDSYIWLLENIKINNVTSMVQASNMDGKEFILKIIKKDMEERWKDKSDCQIHIVMNLPALAFDFLPYFQGLLSNTRPQITDVMKMPYVHAYCFSSEKDPVSDVHKQLQAKLNISINKEGVSIHYVRKVAPNKEMMCASFRMPPTVLFEKPKDRSDDDEDPPTKRFCSDIS